jgi:hypothetical protein
MILNFLLIFAAVLASTVAIGTILFALKFYALPALKAKQLKRTRENKLNRQCWYKLCRDYDPAKDFLPGYRVKYMFPNAINPAYRRRGRRYVNSKWGRIFLSVGRTYIFKGYSPEGNVMLEGEGYFFNPYHFTLAL